MPIDHISGMTEARVAKFCMQVEIRIYQMLAWDDKLAPNGRGQCHVTRFLTLPHLWSR